MVGAALARLLAQADFRVAVVEKEDLIEQHDAPEHDIRVSAINPGSERILSASGAWDWIARKRISPYQRMFVWDENSDGSIEFDSADLGVAHLGTIVENNLVACGLHRALLQSTAVRILSGSSVEQLNNERGQVSVRLSDGGAIRARLLVGADGARSRVREALGIHCKSHDFRQLGIVATVMTEKDHQQTAWQRFLSTGPLAFLPLSDGSCSIVWSCKQGAADELMSLDDDRFAEELARAFDHRLGAIVEVGTRRTFSLRSSHADRYVSERTALVGDAAHVVHPLAGQGVNLGFQDAAALAEVLVEARDRGKDIGGTLTLRRYERWRKGENLAMYHSMNSIEKLFSTERKAVCGIRGLGLRLTDSVGPLKSVFARRAMGLTGDLPKIAT